MSDHSLFIVIDIVSFLPGNTDTDTVKYHFLILVKYVLPLRLTQALNDFLFIVF